MSCQIVGVFSGAHIV